MRLARIAYERHIFARRSQGFSTNPRASRAGAVLVAVRACAMIPFAIAGLQAPVAHGTDNLPGLSRTIGHALRRFPWVRMVVLSELAAYGYLPQQAEPPGGAAEIAFRALARKHGIWLIPGSHF